MKKRIFCLTACIALLIALSLPVGGQGFRRVVYYEVLWGDCVVGPAIPVDTVVGEWTRDCEGNLTGWGIGPFVQGCNWVIVTHGELCPWLPE